jgi:integrase
MGIYKKGKVWWMIRQHDGKKVEKSLNTKNKRVAESRFAQIVTQIEDGSYFRKPERSHSMKDVIDRYMKEVSPRQKSHERNKEIASHWKDFLGDRLISEVTASILSSYKAKRLTGEIRYGKSNDTDRRRIAGESTVKKELAFLRQVFNMAIDEWEIYNINPVKKVIKGLKDRKRVRYVLPEEAERLRFTLPSWLRPLVIVACHTGLREANIVRLTVSQCDFRNERINIHDAEMKNDDPFSTAMTVEVKAVLLNVLRSRKITSPYVFTDEQGCPYSRHSVSMAFRRACKRAGIHNLRFNDLRHDFATFLVNNGISLYQIQHALGHKDQRMSARYAHLLPENKDVAKCIEGKGTTTILLQSEEKKGAA